MGVIYSGQTIVNTLIDGSTADSFIAGLRNVLLSAGWSIAKDGSQDAIWRLRSAQTPQGLRGDLWIRRYGTSSVQPLLNASSILASGPNSSLQTQADFLLTVGAGYNFRVIANPFYAYVVREAIPCPASQSYFIAVPYVPPFLSGLVTEAVLAIGPTSAAGSIPAGMFAGNAGEYSQLNGQGRTGNGQWYLYGVNSYNKPVWFDDSNEFYEARCLSYQTSGTGQASGTLRCVGYVWDALVLNSAVPRGTVIAYDGGSWLVLTENTDPGLMVKVA
ncbi:MAG: hypothetical protein NTY38_26025 [Acidobacteria bacterium]|nr:hypothetical protein [Acidobacteriota bacterium]